MFLRARRLRPGRRLTVRCRRPPASCRGSRDCGGSGRPMHETCYFPPWCFGPTPVRRPVYTIETDGERLSPSTARVGRLFGGLVCAIGTDVFWRQGEGYKKVGKSPAGVRKPLPPEFRIFAKHKQQALGPSVRFRPIADIGMAGCYWVAYPKRGLSVNEASANMASPLAAAHVKMRSMKNACTKICSEKAATQATSTRLDAPKR